LVILVVSPCVHAAILEILAKGRGRRGRGKKEVGGRRKGRRYEVGGREGSQEDEGGKRRSKREPLFGRDCGTIHRPGSLHPP
jgi:hypothetical protein